MHASAGAAIERAGTYAIAAAVVALERLAAGELGAAVEPARGAERAVCVREPLLGGDGDPGEGERGEEKRLEEVHCVGGWGKGVQNAVDELAFMHLGAQLGRGEMAIQCAARFRNRLGQSRTRISACWSARQHGRPILSGV
ncbi:hypothetical protein HWV62_41062 [Athelia sp. TMB]|nr:hypothetical protein HWV62_41062 [Athelia sp. TMB]